MRQIYRVKTNLFGRPQLVGRARMLQQLTVEQATAKLEAAAAKLVQEARWAGFRTPINELRQPLLELRLARRIAKEAA